MVEFHGGGGESGGGHEVDGGFASYIGGNIVGFALEGDIGFSADFVNLGAIDAEIGVAFAAVSESGSL